MPKKKKIILGDKSTDIRIKVVPRSSVNEVVGREGNIYRIKITSPPVDGLANKTLMELLAKWLGVSKGCIEIISGQRSRIKTLRIQGLSLSEIMALLDNR